MRIGVIGGGVVGSATARAYAAAGHDVRVFDTRPERSAATLGEALDAALVFVCLPTPGMPGQLHPDLSAVDGFFASDGVRGTATPFVLRSTVPLGTTRRLRYANRLPNLVYQPEFLTARTSFADAMTPAQHVVGGPPCAGRDLLVGLLDGRFPGVSVQVFDNPDEAEAVKLFLNGFFAVKIALFNELRSLADAAGLDWRRVLAGVLGDGRVSHSHTSVPGPDGLRGFGGACLPKDLACLEYELVARGLTPACGLVVRAARLRNQGDRNVKVAPMGQAPREGNRCEL